jgi:hypothetical protein
LGVKKDLCEKREEDSVDKLLESKFSEIQYFQDFDYFNSITGTRNEMITSRGLNPITPKRPMDFIW